MQEALPNLTTFIWHPCHYLRVKLANSPSSDTLPILPGPREHCISSAQGQQLHLTGLGPLSSWILLALVSASKLSLSYSLSCFLPVSHSPLMTNIYLSTPFWKMETFSLKLAINNQENMMSNSKGSVPIKTTNLGFCLFVLAQPASEQIWPHRRTRVLSDHPVFYRKPQSLPTVYWMWGDMQ